MKTIYLSVLAAISLVCFTGCDDNKESFVDLETGKTITVVKDSTTGYIVNAETKQPVGIYVNTKTNDTIYGRTGKVINNMVVKSPDGKFTYTDESEIKVKVDTDVNVSSGDGDGDYKKKVEKDGDIKIKDGDTKIKIEADGDKKIKRD